LTAMDSTFIFICFAMAEHHTPLLYTVLYIMYYNLHHVLYFISPKPYTLAGGVFWKVAPFSMLAASSGTASEMSCLS